MRDRKDLVLLLGQGLLDLGELRSATNLAVELGDVGAVGPQAVGEAIAKVAGAEDEGVLTSLDQVGGDEIPAQGAGAGDDVGLSGGVGRLEKLAGHGEGLAEGVDEAGADMALAADVSMIRSYSRAWCISPVVAHGLEDGIVELDGPGDEQGRVLWLGRHVGKGSRLCLNWVGVCLRRIEMLRNKGYPVARSSRE